MVLTNQCEFRRRSYTALHLATAIKNLLWKAVRPHRNNVLLLMGYSCKQTDDVINTTTNILHKTNYHIAYVLSFCAGHNISIISSSSAYIIVVIKLLFFQFKQLFYILSSYSYIATAFCSAFKQTHVYMHSWLAHNG